MLRFMQKNFLGTIFSFVFVLRTFSMLYLLELNHPRRNSQNPSQSHLDRNDDHREPAESARRPELNRSVANNENHH